MTARSGCQTKVLLVNYFIFSSLLLTLNMACSDTHSTDLNESVPSNNFCDRLYEQLSYIDGNTVSSPFSLYVVLSSLHQGASGDTLQELQNTLCLQNEPTLEKKIETFFFASNETKEVELYLANALYMQEDLPLLPEFISASTNKFRCSISTVKFGNAAETADKINTWIEGATKNKISNIVSSDDFNEYTKLVLVNAIYFKGHWLHKFDKALTTDREFYISKTETRMVPTMYRKGKYNYGQFRDKRARFVEIPYANTEFVMVVILPDESIDIRSYEKNLQWNDFTKLRRMESTMELYLPRFEVVSTINLKQPLQAMGLISMFGKNADFTRMSSVSLNVDSVIQKVFIEVNEEGSEAAAATVAQLRLRRAIDTPSRFEVNRPFVYAIRHVSNEIPLFLGSIRDIGTRTPNRDEL